MSGNSEIFAGLAAFSFCYAFACWRWASPGLHSSNLGAAMHAKRWIWLMWMWISLGAAFAFSAWAFEA